MHAYTALPTYKIIGHVFFADVMIRNKEGAVWKMSLEGRGGVWKHTHAFWGGAVGGEIQFQSGLTPGNLLPDTYTHSGWKFRELVLVSICLKGIRDIDANFPPFRRYYRRSLRLLTAPNRLIAYGKQQKSKLVVVRVLEAH